MKSKEYKGKQQRMMLPSFMSRFPHAFPFSRTPTGFHVFNVPMSTPASVFDERGVWVVANPTGKLDYFSNKTVAILFDLDSRTGLQERDQLHLASFVACDTSREGFDRFRWTHQEGKQLVDIESCYVQAMSDAYHNLCPLPTAYSTLQVIKQFASIRAEEEPDLYDKRFASVMAVRLLSRLMHHTEINPQALVEEISDCINVRMSPFRWSDIHRLIMYNNLSTTNGVYNGLLTKSSPHIRDNSTDSLRQLIANLFAFSSSWRNS